MPDKIIKNEEEWKKELPPERYRILREKGTEPPFSGKYHHSKEKGMYVCAACGNELFSSRAKFDSGTGWPSFYEAAKKGSVELRPDASYGMARTEVICAGCGSHLGHVFDDLSRRRGAEAGDPPPGARRFCINSLSLDLKKQENKN